MLKEFMIEKFWVLNLHKDLKKFEYTVKISIFSFLFIYIFSNYAAQDS